MMEQSHYPCFYYGEQRIDVMDNATGLNANARLRQMSIYELLNLVRGYERNQSLFF
jgi:hypothetical protein